DLKLSQHGCRVFTLHSGIDAREQYRELIALYNNRQKPDFIFLSPERLATDGFLEYVLQTIKDQIKLIVVDEAHCISQWGLDFRPFYREIPHFLRAIFGDSPLPTILCLTATLNPKDRDQICADFGINAKQHVIRSDVLLRPEINIRVVKVEDEDTKDKEFWALMEQHKAEKVLVYVDRKRGKRSTEELCAEAKDRGFLAAFFHGEMESPQKAEIVRRFKTGEILTVFATSAFGMGIDIPDIRGVVHYLLTESIELYYQQIGRVGRDGNPSWAVIFYSDKNVAVRRKDFIEKSFPTEGDVRHAFSALTDNRPGRRTVNYFQEGDSTQSAYHYLVRSSAITYVCKGVESLDVFRAKRGLSLPEFDTYSAATRTKQLLTTAKKLGKPETEILQHIYRWLAEGKLSAEHSPGKCLVIESQVGSLPTDLLAQILADVEDKKQYRLDMFQKFVDL
ncbi:MAG: ATP-dependent DNA helicase RecQ, partial [Deltaproteobacteria bacterium]|nr:ATP-dependent DNA helicase RecQ [Deltaproteobacteria bacterium]